MGQIKSYKYFQMDYFCGVKIGLLHKLNLLTHFVYFATLPVNIISQVLPTIKRKKKDRC
jgi:hypothetical protein